MSSVVRDHADEINRMTPAAADANLGTVVAALVAAHNDLLAKLDADATAQNAAVTGSQMDTDYAATGTVAALGDG